MARPSGKISIAAAGRPNISISQHGCSADLHPPLFPCRGLPGSEPAPTPEPRFGTWPAARDCSFSLLQQSRAFKDYLTSEGCKLLLIGYSPASVKQLQELLTACFPQRLDFFFFNISFQRLWLCSNRGTRDTNLPTNIVSKLDLDTVVAFIHGWHMHKNARCISKGCCAI